MAKQPKSLNKILATSAGAAVVAGALAPTAALAASAAEDFSDVTEDTRHYEAIDGLYSLGIVSGYNDGTFGPDEHLKRVEAAEMIFAAGDFEEDDEVNYDFTDVPTRVSAMVDALAEEGVISGFTATQFGPNAMLQREEMAKILVEAFDLPYGEDSEVEESDFTDRSETALYPYVDAVAHYGIAEGYENGEFGVGDNILRKDFSAMLWRAMEVAEEVHGDVTVQSLGGTVAEVITGVFAVELSADSINADADSEVQIAVGDEVIDLAYDADEDSFRNLQVAGFTEEELYGASVWVDGVQLGVDGETPEPPVDNDEWVELSALSDYENSQVAQVLTGVYAVEVDLSGEADVTADSEVALVVGEDTFDLTFDEDEGTFRNLQVSGYTKEELEAGIVVYK